jgi:hypothetical protein
MANTPPVIIHLHIPKNAGTSLSRMMKMKLGFWPPANLVHHGTVLGYYYMKHADRVERLRGLTPQGARRLRFVEAHGGFGLHEFIPRPCTYVTVLRQPLDRTVSSFYFQRQEGLIKPDLPIERWIYEDHPHRVWYADNAQVRYLAGERGEIVDVPNGQCTAAMLERAKQRLAKEFLLFGLSERFDESMVLLRRRLGWRSCAYGRTNVTRRRRRVDELPVETLDLIRERNALDIDLYDWAAQRFQEQVQAEGASFEEELRGFRERMQRHGRRFSFAYRLIGIGTNTRRRLMRTLARR